MKFYINSSFSLLFFLGMFVYTGLNLYQCQILIEQHHVYIMNDGRVNVRAITPKNVDDIAQKFYDVVIHSTDGF